MRLASELENLVKTALSNVDGHYSICLLLRRSFFLSDFTSERLSFCPILPQEILLPVRFYLRKTVFLSNFIYLRRSFFLSDFASKPSGFSQIFFLRAPWFLSYFSSEPPRFAQILPQKPPLSFRFYLLI